jgi:hypothetical protein
MLVSRFFLGIGLLQYVTHTFDVVKLQDFVTGLIKAGVLRHPHQRHGRAFLGIERHRRRPRASATRHAHRPCSPSSALITVDLMFTSVFYYLGW